MLDEYWKRNFDPLQPVAHELRDHCNERWVRFHTLPDSKRYAETDSEWKTVLDRVNTLVGHFAKPGSKLELITTNWSSDSKPPAASAEFQKLNLRANHWRSFVVDDDKSNWWHLFHTPITWQPGILDAVFRLVANDEISNVMLVDPTENWLIHPYDGGVDVILESRKARDNCASEFSTWRSKRADGA